MKAIRTFFLRAKHWEIFPAFVAIVLAVLFLPSPYVTQGASDLTLTLFRFPFWYTAVFSICILWIIGWWASMAYFLSDLLPPALKPSKHFLGLACLYAIVYIPISATFFARAEPTSGSSTEWLGVLYLVCTFYVAYAVSRSLILVESGKDSKLKSAGIFFLLWFFPIGVWVVQPRINRLFAERGTKSRDLILS